jgi:leucyl aminopeptidase
MFLRSVNIEDDDFDGLAILFTNVNVDFMQLNSTVLSHLEVDDRLGKEPVLILNENSPGSRLVMGPVGSLNGDVDDVRRFSEAARSLLKCCTSVGIKRPLFWIVDPTDCTRLNSDYRYRKIVTMLALEAQCYIPLQAREYMFPAGCLDHEIGIYNLSTPMASWVGAVNSGRNLAKDIGGADPERMAPMKCANYILDAFRSENEVSVTVFSDPNYLKNEYPLLDAVARASYEVARHVPCVVRKCSI